MLTIIGIYGLIGFVFACLAHQLLKYANKAMVGEERKDIDSMYLSAKKVSKDPDLLIFLTVLLIWPVVLVNVVRNLLISK